MSASSDKPARRRPAATPEAREKQLVSLAYDLAEKQLREGTASSQVISTFLKAGSSRERLEQERLNQENNFLAVKAENLQSQMRSEELFAKAMRAFSGYAGKDDEDDMDSDFGDYDSGYR